jgi:hypothetical protein
VTDDVVGLVLEAIESRLVEASSLAKLSEPEADLILAATAIGVIAIGGLLHWYESKDAQSTLRAALALDRMGLSPAGDAMRKSLQAFPDGRPPRSWTRREAHLSDHRATLKEPFGELNAIIWNSDFDGAAARYIDARLSELIAAAPALAALLRLH